MFLKSLTLKGFKSFAERTHLVFDPGLTVVVGPNGSGKSNVADAILWVLGEQSAKALRGQAMEDVVFCGSKSRKPVSVAEVTLVLDNADHTLPIDFTEVGITRRMYRSGESEYLVNGAPARLMDVQDILHDSGLGKDTHSIISQGRLDTVLASRPEERRALIEEAAGISKHRRRKERSLRKLADMDANLVRARDLARAMNRQLRPLERQADWARRRDELEARLSELSCQLAVDDVRRLKGQWSELQDKAHEATDAVELAQFRADERAHELERLQSMFERRGLFVGDLGEQRRRCSDILGRLESDLRLLEEKGRNMVDRLSETRLSLSQVERQRAEAVHEREEVAGRLLDTRSRVEILAAKVAELEPSVEAATTALRQNGAEQRRLEAEQHACRRELDEVTLAHARLSDELESAGVEDQMFANRLEQLAHAFESCDATRESLRQRADELDAVIEQASDTCAAAQRAIAERVVEYDAANAERTRTEQDLEAARSRLFEARATGTALRRVDAQATGGDVLAKRVLADSALADLVCFRLADVLGVPAELDTLVEHLLAEALAAPVVAGADEVNRLVTAALAQRDAGGSLTVLSLSEPARTPPRGAGTPLVSCLNVDPHVASLVNALLGGVRVVEDAHEAIEAHAADPSLTYVTAEGVVAYPDGRIVTGVSTDAAVGTLARHRQIAKLEADVAVLEAASREAQAVHANACAALEKAQTARSSAHEAFATAAGELSRLRGERSSLDAEFKRLESQAAQAADERAQLAQKREETSQRVKEGRERLAELERQRSEAKANLSTLSRSLDEVSARSREAKRCEEAATAAAADARLELATSRERLDHLEERSAELARRIEALVEQARAAEEGSRSLEVLRLRVGPLHERYEAIRACALAWAERLRDRARLAEADADSLKKTMSAARQQANDAASELERARATQNEIKVESGRLEVRVEQAVAAITADKRHVLEEALEMPAPENREACEREAAALRHQIETIGPVNQVATQEYERLKGRADYVASQLADLEGARKALTKITDAIDRKMRRQFLATFEAVNANFAEVFSLLFRGGEGHLEMTDPDHPAETGIEVVAQPRGKRVAKVTLMSGGERSLTALALLFAVYRARTVPFYVFDEVEAALDDANLDKLLDAIERLKSATQLIVISHQRRTMERADVLYGVSMQADGVSHVVSQRLNRSVRKGG